MQWTEEKNKGFSDGCEDTLYLPVDLSPDAPTVEKQAKTQGSLLNTVKDLITLRHEKKDLQADGSFEVVYAEKEKFPFIYKRGNLIIAVNPSEEQAGIPNDVKNRKILYAIGKTEIYHHEGKMPPQSFLILE